MIYGYARVSTDGQSVDTQVRRLRAAGAHRVFREVANGAQANRPGLRRAIAHLEEGDVLMVMRLDRLARSTRDLLNTLAVDRAAISPHSVPAATEGDPRLCHRRHRMTRRSE
jgi:DNA invertase Pin-like site-specific DNA recombinase